MSDRAIRDLDYVRDRSGVVWLAKGDHHPSCAARAYPVYWPDPCGSRYHPRRGRYSKRVNDAEFSALWELRPETRPRQGDLLEVPVLDLTRAEEIYRPRAGALSFGSRGGETVR